MNPSPIPRETFEWARIWWSHADRSDLPRILLIGDSIIGGYGETVIERLKDRAYVDYLSTSKALGDPAYLKEVAYVLGEYPYAAIHFNNGLHGWHLSADAYQAGLEDLVALIRRAAPEARLVWASSTPVTRAGDVTAFDPEKNPRIVERNRRAADLMRAGGIAIHDLHALMADRPGLRLPDQFHYTPEGQAFQGAAVAALLLDLLPD